MRLLKLIFNIFYVVFLRHRYIGFNLIGRRIRIYFINNLFLFLGIIVLIFGITVGHLRKFNEIEIIKNQILQLCIENNIRPNKVKCKNRLHDKERKLICRLITKDLLIDINCGQTYSLSSGCKIVKIKERM
jgi:hypothetical protein